MLIFFFCNIVFDFAGLFLVAILVRNLYTRDPCEGVRSLPRRQKILDTALIILSFPYRGKRALQVLRHNFSKDRKTIDTKNLMKTILKKIK